MNFDGLKIDKNEINEYISKHYAFIIVKNLFREYMGNKKRSFLKSIINYKSSISFKKKDENVKEITNENNIKIVQENKDCGYFMEYYFGKIDNVYTIKIIDNIQKDCNLGILLDASLWHKNIKMFKEYIKLNQIIINDYKGKIHIDEKLDLPNQIFNINKEIEEIKLIEVQAKKENEISLLGLKKGRDDEDQDSKLITQKRQTTQKRIVKSIKKI